MDTNGRDDENTPADRAGNLSATNRVEALTREELHYLMMCADTLEQCAMAWKAQEDYLRQHPDDDSVIEEGEALWMTEQALKREAEQSKQTIYTTV